MQEEPSYSASESDSADEIVQTIYRHIIEHEEAEAIALLDELDDVNAIVHQGQTLLHCAAEIGLKKLVKALLELGADQMIQDDGDEMLADALPLHYGAYYGHKGCVRALLEDLDAQGLTTQAMETKDYSEFTPLQEAIAAFAEYYDRSPVSMTAREAAMVKTMRQSGIQYVVGLQGYLDIIQSFIDTDQVATIAWDPTSDAHSDVLPFGCNLAHLAARYDILNLFDYLFDHCLESLYQREKLNRPDHEDEDALHEPSSVPVGPTAIHTLLCAEFDQNNFCQQFLLRNLGSIDLDVVDRYERSVLFYLAMNNNVQMMQPILKQNPDLNTIDRFGNTTYHYAVLTQSVDALALLLTHSTTNIGVNLNYLLHSAVECCKKTRNSAASLDILRLLINCPLIDVNAKDRHGRTAFMLATLHRNTAVLKIIQTHPEHDPNQLVVETGVTKQRLDLEEDCRDALDMEVHTGDPLFDAANEAVVETLAEFALVNQQEEGIIYSDDEDEGDAPIHQAIKQHKGGQKRLLETLLEDERVDDRLRNSGGTKALKLAKEEDPEAFDQLRQAQYDHYKESSTGSSGSEDDEGQSSYKRILQRALAEEPDQDDLDDSPVTVTEAQINRDLATLNLTIKHNGTAPQAIGERYCVIHYRGINFLRDIFNHEQRRDYGTHHHEQSGVHSKFSHNNTQITLDIANRTEADEQRLNQLDQLCREMWQKIFLRSRDRLIPWWSATGQNQTGYITYAHMVQCRYSNTACGKDEANPLEKTDIWEEIWRAISTKIQPEIQAIPELAAPNVNLLLSGNPLVSTGKSPQHAIRYALGKSLAEMNRDKRMDSRYDSSARPKYELIGKVHWFCHSVTDYLRAQPNDVLFCHKSEFISLNSRLLNETEVAFVGGIAAQHHAGSLPIVQPRFDIDFDPAYHQQLMGLSELQYAYFKKGFMKAQRPSKHRLDIFEKGYHEKLQLIFNLNSTQFAQYKQLLELVNACRQSGRKKIELNHLKPFQDLLLKEINIKWADQANPAQFYGKKEVDKYWHKPKPTVSISRLLTFVEKNLHDRSPYRKLKNELRDHLVDFYSEQIYLKAIQEAKAKGKIPLYRAPDGSFKRLPSSAAELKKHLFNGAIVGKKSGEHKVKVTAATTNNLGQHSFKYSQPANKESEPAGNRTGYPTPSLGK